MPQIIGGTKRGLRFLMPKEGTRPLTQRTKESLFQIIEMNYFAFHNIKVLDLFAGSGSFGLEAISRGAKTCTFVELGNSQIKILSKNVKNLSFSENSTIKRKNVSDFLISNSKEYNIIFLDPPFSFPDNEVDVLVQKCKDYVLKNGLIIVHRSKYSVEPEILSADFQKKEKKYGDSMLYLFHNNSIK